MLTLHRGRVVGVGEADGGGVQRLEVEVDGGRHTAVADVGLVGPAEVDDEVVVNTAARELKLGSGGFDIVHVNLTRGLGGRGVPGAHVMKLNYTSLQHAVRSLEGPELSLPLTSPVAVTFLHGQLAPVAWAFAQAAPGRSLGYVQTAGGALPGSLSHTVAELRARGLLAGHLTAAPAFGGEGEAITVAGALHHAGAERRWDAVVCGPGPGIQGSASALGHGGLAALDNAHAALALAAPTLIVPRMSSADPRERHRGISHHVATVLALVLDTVVVAAPDHGDLPPLPAERHEWRTFHPDLDGYAASGLPACTMGRGIAQDPLFFAAGLAGGAALAGMIQPS
jgi:hypothetical protein